MRVVRSVSAMQKLSLGWRAKHLRVAFVPTMGYLHRGHLKLVAVAKRRADVTVASLFVNPSQFGPKEDFSRYPRDEKGDLRKLKGAGVDCVFMPRAADMYPPGFQTAVVVKEAGRGLCGASRPGHFEGVATVVLKLFNIVRPTLAVFGKKDFQQCRVIAAMVRDLNLPLRLFFAETVRDADGLALSSRNAYLSPEERALALGLPRGLKAAKAACLAGKEVRSSRLREIFLRELPRSPAVRLDYFECRDAETLAPLAAFRKGRTLLAAAVFFGKTRLIDNVTC